MEKLIVYSKIVHRLSFKARLSLFLSIDDKIIVLCRRPFEFELNLQSFRRRRRRNDDMGDLDISLIKEFARRPGFYDRSNSHFKNKAYVQQAWMEISNQLGYDAHLLKDRMYQLRNRYNLEKRRLENLRLEDPSKSVRSPWPLFYHLTFLDGHIRPRRSFKSMMRHRTDTDSINEADEVIPSGAMLLNNATNSSSTTSSNQYQSQISKNGHTVKYETEVESDEEQPNISNGNHFLDPTNFLADDSEEGVSETTQNNYHHPPPASSSQSNGRGINVKNIETLKRDLCIDDSHLQPAKKFPKKLSRYEKYEAFGKFLSISLCDLAEHKALELVEKFTSDVVRALIENNSK